MLLVEVDVAVQIADLSVVGRGGAARTADATDAGRKIQLRIDGQPVGYVTAQLQAGPPEENVVRRADTVVVRQRQHVLVAAAGERREPHLGVATDGVFLVPLLLGLRRRGFCGLFLVRFFLLGFDRLQALVDFVQLRLLFLDHLVEIVHVALLVALDLLEGAQRHPPRAGLGVNLLRLMVDVQLQRCQRGRTHCAAQRQRHGRSDMIRSHLIPTCVGKSKLRPVGAGCGCCRLATQLCEHATNDKVVV